MQPSNDRMLTGRCNCGAVHYAVADDFAYALNCHCVDCRRATGAAFKSFGGIARARFALTEGADRLMIVGEGPNHDARCAACGALLYSLVRDGAYVHVLLGTLDGATTLRPAAHIFVRSKAPWFEITDNLPQHEEHVR